jgi:hypothetical protein
MKYLFCHLFILIGINQFLNAQIYFSNRYDFLQNATPSYSHDIIRDSIKYILINESIHGIQEYRIFGFITLDTMGNRVGIDIVFEDSTRGLTTGYPGSFIRTQNNTGFSLVGFNYNWVPTGRWDRGMLWRFDNNLDTLWTKTYNDYPPHDTSFLFRNFRPLPDGGFIIVGSHGLVDGTAPIRINLHRVDSLGNLIWRKYYGSGIDLYYLPYDVTTTSDGGFVIGGVLFPISGSASQDDDPILIKTDSSGNQQWLRHLGNPDCTEEYAMVDLAIDGNVLAGTIYSDSCWGPNDHFSKINIIKINNNNIIIWDKKYGIHKFWLRFNKIRTLENGDIIATGSYDYFNDITGYEVSWILKTDSAGNELWYREYMLLTATFSENILYNVIPTSDYGFIACGTVWPYPPDTGTQDSWVLKVDSIGCEGPGNCWVGQDEIWVKSFTPEKPFIVYPNPATDRLTLEFHINPDGAELELYNLTGQMVLRTRVPRERDLFEWDIGRVGRGMYILKVSMPGRRAVMERVVVQH